MGNNNRNNPPLIGSQTKEKLVRCEHAHSNGMETLPLFATAVVAANTAGVPVSSINSLALLYLGLRVAYNITYVALQDNKNLAPLRTLFWVSGTITWMYLFAKAGSRLLEASR
jgi:uncharacterized MAPEG superfamily protein